MRNYEQDIEELTEIIRELQTENRRNRTQINRLTKQKTKDQNKTKQEGADRDGNHFRVGDKVKALTSGKFHCKAGTVVSIKKWVTFRATDKSLQSRAPGNLRVIKDAQRKSRYNN